MDRNTKTAGAASSKKRNQRSADYAVKRADRRADNMNLMYAMEDSQVNKAQTGPRHAAEGNTATSLQHKHDFGVPLAIAAISAPQIATSQPVYKERGPVYKELCISTATVTKVISQAARNSTGNLTLIGFCKFDLTESVPAGQKCNKGQLVVKHQIAPKDAFFFHGTPAVSSHPHGFKCGGEIGVVESAGLQLDVGDKLGFVEVVTSDAGMKVLRASLHFIALKKILPRLEGYLTGLAEALNDTSKRDAALACLCQHKSSTVVWNTISKLMIDNVGVDMVIRVLEMLVYHTTHSGSTTGRTAKTALQITLMCNISLPPNSLLGRLMQRDRVSRSDLQLRALLISVLLKTWVVCDKQLHRRIFLLLQDLLCNHPSEVMQLLPPEQLMQLLGSTLTQGDDLLACYGWRELPLYLLPSEMRVSNGENGALLQCVKKAGGSYETFEQYMETNVGLLRENAFANMRSGLCDLRKGKLDSRDMRVFTGVKLVAMSPPAFNSRAEGTVLELRTGGSVGAGGEPPMFGALLALAPQGNFEDSMWATVAGAEVVKGSMRIYAELCAGPYRDSSECESFDASVVASLMRDTGEMSVAESPTFYRAYEPALSALQSLHEDEMPFYHEIILGENGLKQPCLEGVRVDATIAFELEDCMDDAALKRISEMDALEFVRALDYFSDNPEHALNLKLQGYPVRLFDGVPLLSTRLDASQCQALKSSLTQRITMVQGPPGCGKTFVGVRVARLLLSMTSAAEAILEERRSDSTADVSLDNDGPMLVVTYKNVALDDFLDDCNKIWPTGVARLGGRPLAGSATEHRHMSVLLRNAKSYRSSEHEHARKAVEDKRSRVEEAAQILSESRYFSPHTLCSEHDDARALLQRLVLSDDTDSSQERQEAITDIESQDVEKVLLRAAKTLARWLPTEKMVASLCRQLAANTCANGVAKHQTMGESKSEKTEEQNEQASDRSRYTSFEKATVSLEPRLGKDERFVMHLKDAISDVEKYRILNNEDVRLMDIVDRVRLMHTLVKVQFDAALQVYAACMEDYVKAVAQFRRHETDIQVQLLRSMKVVGMTISGAAISRDLIQKLRPCSVLVEEAAEVLEPLLVASLGSWVQRLILIGDNEQLPPQVETHSLAKDYQFDTSLMHRLIANKLPLVTLTSQSRMMPEFAQLLKDVYPLLETSNRVDVTQRLSPPAGFKTSMWFWNVESTEGEKIDPVRRSHINNAEADAVMVLVVHLLRSGIKPQQITLLAPYAAQVDLLRNRALKAVKVESESTWPTQKQGDAALKKLDALKRMPSTPPLDSIQVADTFLMLGMLDEALMAINVAHRQTGASTPSAFSTIILKYIHRINTIIRHKCCVDDYWDGVKGTAQHNGDSNVSIQAVKMLETLASQWMLDCVPMAAAACSLRSRLAEQINKAPGVQNAKRTRFVDGLKKGADALLHDLSSRECVCVSSIDRYQGSENDIVIISLVRTEGVGFLKERARRVVAQSRARLGMYFVGNIRNYSSNSAHWKTLISSMKQSDRAGNSIQICCAQHGGSFNVALNDSDSLIQGNPCAKPCGMLMGCGLHTCTQQCHGSGVDRHSVCNKLVDSMCTKGHNIKRRCCEGSEDVSCKTCQHIAEETRRSEQQASQKREENAQKEIDHLILEMRLQPPNLFKHDLKRHGADAVEFLQVMDRTEKYVQAAHTNVCVTRIQKITNATLEQKFLEAKKRLQSGASGCNLQSLFHGTGTEGVEGIPNSGFRLPAKSEDNMFGRGVYFATDSSKSAQHMYTKGSNSLLLCDVLMGKACEVLGLAGKSKSPLSKYIKKSSKKRLYLDVEEEDMRRERFDSVFAPRGTRDDAGVQFDEMIVYNAAQALPRYIVHFGCGSSRSKEEWKVQGQAIAMGGMMRTLKAQEIGSNVCTDLEEFNIACGQFLRLLPPTITAQRQVTKVDVYESRIVKDNYERKRSDFAGTKKSTKEVWVFHGTNCENIHKICCEGFKIGGAGVAVAHGSAYGKGVYSATGPSTPMGYGNGANAVILCKALPGDIDTDMRDSWRPNADSDWLIFKTAEQLLPVYVVHFRSS